MTVGIEKVRLRHQLISVLLTLVDQIQRLSRLVQDFIELG